MSSVVSSTVTSMFDLAGEFLSAVTAAMATTDAGAPDESYITLGDPAWDTLCGQAVVMIPQLGEGATNPSSPPEQTGMRHTRGRINLVSMVAYAVRCAVSVDSQNLPPFQAPSTDTLTAIAKAGYEDGWAVWNYVNRAIDRHELFGGPCIDAHMEAGTPFTPEAGLGGWRFLVRVELGGYDPTGS